MNITYVDTRPIVIKVSLEPTISYVYVRLPFITTADGNLTQENNSRLNMESGTSLGAQIIEVKV